MRTTRKYITPGASNYSFSHRFAKDSLSKVIYFSLIAYLFFVSVVMVADLLSK